MFELARILPFCRSGVQTHFHKNKKCIFGSMTARAAHATATKEAAQRKEHRPKEKAQRPKKKAHRPEKKAHRPKERRTGRKKAQGPKEGAWAVKRRRISRKKRCMSHQDKAHVGRTKST
jgi:hypothetical protein